MKNFIIRAVAICLCAPLSAHSTLINLGDVTRDTNTGLDWLDLTISAGMTYDDFQSGAGGLLDDGWSIVVGSDVATLFESNIGISEGDFSSDLLPLLLGSRTLALLGCTLSVNSDLCQYSTVDPNDPLTFATLGIYDDLNITNPLVGLSDIVVRIDGSDVTIIWQTFDDFWQTDQSEPQIGIFLNRVVAVPEPGTLALLVIGLLGLRFSRRKHGAAV